MGKPTTYTATVMYGDGTTETLTVLAWDEGEARAIAQQYTCGAEVVILEETR